MKKSFPSIKTPIGFLPSCIEVEGVPLRVAVIEYNYGPTRVGYTLEKKTKLDVKTRMKIESVIANELDTRLLFWSNNDVDDLGKGFERAEEWKWK